MPAQKFFEAVWGQYVSKILYINLFSYKCHIAIAYVLLRPLDQRPKLLYYGPSSERVTYNQWFWQIQVFDLVAAADLKGLWNYIISKWTKILSEFRICPISKGQSTNKVWVDKFVKSHFLRENPGPSDSG